MSSPTLTSFYTSYDPKIRQLQIPQKFVKKTVVNRTEDATPYICLRAILTQCLCNKFLLLLIFVALQVQVFCTLLSYGLTASQVLFELSCLSISSSGSSQAAATSEFTTIALSSVTDSALVIANVAQFSLMSSIENAQMQAVGYLNQMAASYECTAHLVSFGASNSALNVTKSMNDWYSQNLDIEVDAAQRKVNNLSKAISNLEKALSSDSSLFSSVNLNPGTNISLADIATLQAPEAISSVLQQLNSSSNFGFSSIAFKSSSDIQSAVFKYTSQLNGTTTYGPCVPPNMTNLAQPSIILEAYCSSASQVSEYYSQMQTKIGELQRNAIVILSILGLMTILLVAVYEYFAWKNTLLQSRALSTPGNSIDPVDHFHVVSNPLSSWIVMVTARKIFPDDESLRTLYRWFVAYVFSDTMLSVLGVFLALLILYSCERSAIDIVDSVAHNKMFAENTGISPTPNATAMGPLVEWVSDVNRAVQAAENASNTAMEEMVSSSLSDMRTILVNAHSQMESRIKSLLSLSMGIESNWTIYDDYPFATFQFSGLAYPLLNASTLQSSLNSISDPSSLINKISTSATSIAGDNNSIGGLLSKFEYVASVHLDFAMAMLAIWIVYTLVGFGYILKPGLVMFWQRIGEKVQTIRIRRLKESKGLN